MLEMMVMWEMWEMGKVIKEKQRRKYIILNSLSICSLGPTRTQTVLLASRSKAIESRGSMEPLELQLRRSLES